MQHKYTVNIPHTSMNQRVPHAERRHIGVANFCPSLGRVLVQ